MPFTDSHAELLALAEEAGQLGVFVWRVKTGAMNVSRKFLSLYGLDEFEGGYEDWLQCLFREDVLRVRNLVDEALHARRRDFQAEFRIVRRNDRELRWIDARSVVLYDGDGQPERVVGVNADLTERKRSLLQLHAFAGTLEERVRERTRQLEAENEARLRAEEQLRQAQKMEAVGQLTGGIAHDFNNLMTIVLGGLETIGRQLPRLAGDQAARMGRAHAMALHGAQRAVALTDRLLAFSRQQPLEPSAVDANDLVAGVSEFLQRTLGESVALETVLSAGLWRAFADAHQLENAILNLALNARDAMPNGGKVTIETANCHLDEGYAATVTEPLAVGQYVMIAVGDTGAGMDRATIDRAFEPFFTTKESGKGTGLGLSQVYGFVRQSAGHVRIYSEIGEGTTVKIYLPRHALGGDRETASRTAAEAGFSRGAETILVVEDDKALRSYAMEILGENGYRVLEAPDAASAMALLEREQRVDLLFTDVVMPGGVDGRQLADEALRRRPGLRVLFTTGYTRSAIVHHGRLDAGIDFIGKPYSFAALSEKIRLILDRATRP